MLNIPQKHRSLCREVLLDLYLKQIELIFAETSSKLVNFFVFCEKVERAH